MMNYDFHMGEIKKGIRNLILRLLIAKTRYSEWLQKNKDSELKPLAEEAMEQKKLQALEVCRLFHVDQSEAVPPEKLRKEVEKEKANTSMRKMIKHNEERIKELYRSLIQEEKVNVFESFVLTNHLRNEERLLRKIE